MIRRFFACLVFLAVAAVASAQQEIPTPAQFLGYDMGERFTPYERILDYFSELARRANLVTIQRIGETYEQRPLVLATITSPKNQAALDSIRGKRPALADAMLDLLASLSKIRRAIEERWLALPCRLLTAAPDDRWWGPLRDVTETLRDLRR